jgi:uncharacterized protein (TIGR03118 family)
MKTMKLAMKFVRQSTGIALVALLLPCVILAQYTRTDLVSNTGVSPNPPDPNLVNGWGLVSLATSPYWVSNNGTGTSTLYTSTGQKMALTVAIPSAGGSAAPGQPTGIVGNTAADPNAFVVSEGGVSGKAVFIFATFDGTISGWNPQVGGAGPGAHATIGRDRSGFGAVYTGLAIGVNGTENLLYAADDGPNRRIDVFNSQFTVVEPSPNAFTDPKIPKEFAPYGIQNIHGDIWVTYTAVNKGQGGFVDRFGADGTLKQHFAVHGPLHSPWGLAQAPSDFGPMSNAILVSNNIPRGRINAFDATTGSFLGPLRDASGNPIEIDDVWALEFGQDGGPNGAHNQLFFTAGPNNYANGLFGVIAFTQ